MGVTQKSYDYDRVIDFTNTGGQLDTSLNELQENLIKLKELFNRCEQVFHGVGSTSTIYKEYEKLYNKIGTKAGGMWQVVRDAYDLENLMYNNALEDRRLDNGE